MQHYVQVSQLEQTASASASRVSDYIVSREHSQLVLGWVYLQQQTFGQPSGSVYATSFGNDSECECESDAFIGGNMGQHCSGHAGYCITRYNYMHLTFMMSAACLSVWPVCIACCAHVDMRDGPLGRAP